MSYTSKESLVSREANEAIDALEVALLSKFDKVNCPLEHFFVPGMYIRKIFMAKGTKITSKIHKHRHPFFVLSGSANVWTPADGWQLIKAPHFGITEPGTRRVLDILSDTVWVTVHHNPDDSEDMEVVEDRVIEKHDNELLGNIKSDQLCPGFQ